MNLQRTLVALFVLGMVAAAAPGYAQHDAEVTYYKDILPIMQENCRPAIGRPATTSAA